MERFYNFNHRIRLERVRARIRGDTFFPVVIIPRPPPSLVYTHTQDANKAGWKLKVEIRFSWKIDLMGLPSAPGLAIPLVTKARLHWSSPVYIHYPVAKWCEDFIEMEAWRNRQWKSSGTRLSWSTAEARTSFIFI